MKLLLEKLKKKKKEKKPSHSPPHLIECTLYSLLVLHLCKDIINSLINHYLITT